MKRLRLGGPSFFFPPSPLRDGVMFEVGNGLLDRMPDSWRWMVLVWGIASFLVHVNLGVMEFTSRVGLSSFVVIDFTVLGQFQFRDRVHDSGLDIGDFTSISLAI